MHRGGVVGLLCLALAGCSGPVQQPVADNRSLYDRLGGEPAIRSVVDKFVANVVADPNIKEAHKKHFREGDVAGLKKKLVDQIGQATGGPQKYTGKDMKEAHRGLGITEADFDALKDDLMRALSDNEVGRDEKREIEQLIESMRKDVIEAGGPKEKPAEKPKEKPAEKRPD